MSVSSIIDPITGKIFDNLIGQGGGVSLTKGQLITANAQDKEVAFPTVAPADGTILSYDSNEPFGLKYIAVPGAVAIDFQQILSANNANAPTAIPAPAQNKYVLTANNDPANATGLAWEPVGGTGKVSASAPLGEEAGQDDAANIYINFSGSVGEIPYGNGTAKVGALTNVPAAGQILGISGGVPTWIPAGGSGTVVGVPPLAEEAGGTNESKVYLNFTAVKGEIPAGNGTAQNGAMVPAPPQDKYVLSSDSNEATGLKWVAVSASGLISTVEPLKDTVSGGDNLLFIDFTAQGDLPVGTAAGAGAGVIQPVGTEGQVLSVYSKNTSGLKWIDNTPSSGGNIIVNRGNIATQEIQPPTNKNDTMFLVAEEAGPAWEEQPNPTDPKDKQPYLMESKITLTNGDEYVVVKEVVDGRDACYLVNITLNPAVEVCKFLGPVGWNAQVLTMVEAPANSIVIGGRFTLVDTLIGTNAGTFQHYNTCIYSLPSPGNPLISSITPTTIGMAYSTQIDTYGSCVSQIIIQAPATYWFFGSFDCLVDSSLAPAQGYGNIVSLDKTTNTFLTPAQITTTNLKAFSDAPTFGEVKTAYWNAGFTKLFVGGNFTKVGSAGTPLVAWGVWQGNSWATTITPINALSINSGRVSSVLANKFLIMGEDSSTTTGFIKAIDLTNNQITNITLASPLPPQYYGSYNCITSGNVDPNGAGLVQLDAILFYEDSDTPAQIYYITAASGNNALLLPASNEIYAGVSAYGITTAQGPSVLELQVGGKDALYNFDSTTKPNIEFTLPAGSNFIVNSVLKGTARFASPAGMGQSFVASLNALNWIMVGAAAVGLTFP